MVLSGEVRTKAYIDVQEIARRVIKRIGYTKQEYRFDSESCGVISTIHEQSPDINQGVDKKNKKDQGAGDQGMMFGYATRETENYMPLALDLAHKILQELSEIRNNEPELIAYLRPDAKSQVTIEYSDDKVSVLGGFSVMKNFNDKIGLRTILRDFPILCSWSLDDQKGE